MRSLILSILFWVFPISCASAAEQVSTRTTTHNGDRYTVVTVTLGIDADVRVYCASAGGITLSNARDTAAREQRDTIMLTNGGMYGPDTSPVGLCVSNNIKQHSIDTGEGTGNFYMQPNGVFWVDTGGIAHVTKTSAFPVDRTAIYAATQSGPMLLIDGTVNSEFGQTSTNRVMRSGVGVSADGKTVQLVVSESNVRFYDFATLFRDVLVCDDALFLDGVVSRMWTTGDIPTARYGTAIAVTRKKK